MGPHPVCIALYPSASRSSTSVLTDMDSFPDPSDCESLLLGAFADVVTKLVSYTSSSDSPVYAQETLLGKWKHALVVELATLDKAAYTTAVRFVWLALDRAIIFAAPLSFRILAGDSVKAPEELCAGLAAEVAEVAELAPVELADVSLD